MLLFIGIIIILCSLWWIYHPSTIEKYTNSGDEEHMRAQKSGIDYLVSNAIHTLMDSIKLAFYDPSVAAKDETIVLYEKNALDNPSGDYDINTLSNDIMNNKPIQQIAWSKVNVSADAIMANKLNVTPRSKTNYLIDDGCSTRGLLNSNFKEDICVKYGGDPVVLNEKCKELSPNNCKIPSCCVLLKGDICVGGNVQGPLFLTDEGKSVDYSYYYYKNKCYGDCLAAANYSSACDKYGANSTNISKNCMVKMFNNAGCPNRNPTKLINEGMAQSYSETTKTYVEDYINKAVSVIMARNDDESKTLCYG